MMKEPKIIIDEIGRAIGKCPKCNIYLTSHYNRDGILCYMCEHCGYEYPVRKTQLKEWKKCRKERKNNGLL